MCPVKVIIVDNDINYSDALFKIPAPSAGSRRMTKWSVEWSSMIWCSYSLWCVKSFNNTVLRFIASETFSLIPDGDGAVPGAPGVLETMPSPSTTDYVGPLGGWSCDMICMYVNSLWRCRITSSLCSGNIMITARAWHVRNLGAAISCDYRATLRKTDPYSHQKQD